IATKLFDCHELLLFPLVLRFRLRSRTGHLGRSQTSQGRGDPLSVSSGPAGTLLPKAVRLYLFSCQRTEVKRYLGDSSWTITIAQIKQTELRVEIHVYSLSIAL